MYRLLGVSASEHCAWHRLVPSAWAKENAGLNRDQQTSLGTNGVPRVHAELTEACTAVCPAGQHAIRRDRVRGADPGWRHIFSRRHCGPCPLRARCAKSVRGPRILQITAESERRQQLRRIQRAAALGIRFRRRIMAEHRIARRVQIEVWQAHYRGRSKVAFQVALAAALANLTLAQNAAPAPRPSAAALAVLTERVRDRACASHRGL